MNTVKSDCPECEKGGEKMDTCDFLLSICNKHRKIEFMEEWRDYETTMEKLMSFDAKHYDIDVSEQRCPECPNEIKKPS